MPTDESTRWFPHTSEDSQIVLSELSVMLSSHHFKNSKRYPALLSYVVGKALEGRTEHLKERTLGVEVFGRQPDYDTNADPIVRVTAGEIRKKIAQFYHDKGKGSCLQIDLPLGSYLPEFKRVLVSPSSTVDMPSTLSVPSNVATLDSGEKAERPGQSASAVVAKAWNQSRSMPLPSTVGLTIAVAFAVCFGVYAFHQRATQDATEEFWSPLLTNPSPVLIVIPGSTQRLGHPASADGAELVRLSHGPYNYISVCDAVALSRFSSLLGKRSKQLDVREASLTSLNDLHERSAVLLGAINNHWTMRLTEPLRFHFSDEGSSVRIVDTQHLQAREWTVDYTKPYALAMRDYAIIARYRDATTGGNVLVIAGIGAHATQAASEFVVTPKELEQIGRLAPRGWESRNIEMVIETDIINGDSGPPHLIAVASW